MTPERWQEIKGNVLDSFQVEDQGSYHDDDMGGVDIEFIEFQGPLGLMRLEFETHKVVTGKKTTYSNRIGSETKVDYQYDPTEKSHKLMVYKYDESQDDWVEVDQKNFRI